MILQLTDEIRLDEVFGTQACSNSDSWFSTTDKYYATALRPMDTNRTSKRLFTAAAIRCSIESECPS